jgi:hypothetical protein
MRKYLILFIFILFTKTICSQTFHIGAMAGYGRVWTHYEPERLGAWNENSISFVVDFKPVKPMFDFNSGLTFQTVYWNGSTINLLNLPLGMDLLIGNKNQFFFGFGIYGQSVLFGTSYSFDNTYLHFQFGAYADFGFRFRLNDNYSLFFKFQYDRGLTPMYIRSYRSPGGSSYTENEFLRDMSINIGFKFKLNHK